MQKTSHCKQSYEEAYPGGTINKQSLPGSWNKTKIQALVRGKLWDGSERRNIL